MIYAMRPRGNEQVCTRIEFRGFEISIAMDAFHAGSPALMRRTLAVYYNDRDVTANFYPSEGVRMTLDGVVDCTGDDLFDIMKQIVEATPNFKSPHPKKNTDCDVCHGPCIGADA